MSTHFFRTLRALDTDRSHGSVIAFAAAAALFAGWTGWFFFSSVTLYESSLSARIEASEQAHRIESPVAGQLRSISVEIGQEVRAGATVAVLDASAVSHSLAEVRAQHREAGATARLTAEEARRLDLLFRGGQISELDNLRARAAADKALAASEALAASIARLTHEIARRQIKAPVAGRIAEVNGALRPGSMLHEGDQLATVVPLSEFRIVAWYAPAAIGRVRKGQPARMRLEGFPWAQFGMLSGEVTGVSTEVRDGRIRVEHAVNTDPNSGIVPQHGLPGLVEVAVERVSPANLALRMAGTLLTRTGFRGLAQERSE